MKIRIICFIIIAVFSLSAISIVAEDLPHNSFMAAFCVNYDTAFINGEEISITKPLLAFENTYVNLYDFAIPLGLIPLWITEGEQGYLSVSQPNSGKTVNFTFIRSYDELSYPNKLFSKDGATYISANDLALFTDHPPLCQSGIVTLGYTFEEVSHLFPEIEPLSVEEYIYTTYPKQAEYVVNPYVPYSYETMMNDADKLAKLYPDIIKLSSIGQSVENRKLLLIEFGKGEKKIFVCGAHHAREYITTTYILYAIDRYSYAYRNNCLWEGYNVNEILDNVTFCIVPMVNPDGVNIVQNGFEASPNADALSNMTIYDSPKNGFRAWKANANGVDVNWNYDKDWTITRNKTNVPASTGFNGTLPNTEPETRAVSAYVDSIPFEAFFSVHSQGQIFYYADDIFSPTNLDKILKAETGFAFYYESATGTGGSFFDYVYRKYGKVTMTIELCPYKGPFPYPDEDFDTVWTPVKNIMLIIGNKIMQTNNTASDAVLFVYQPLQSVLYSSDCFFLT